ncbi:hypothetical protein MTO96_015262 [Rhipicephalus appendiculatus]
MACMMRTAALFCALSCFLGVATPYTVFDCTSPPDIKYCTILRKLWYFDPGDRHCKMFYWGGCFTNNNRYESEHECKEACRINQKAFARQQQVNLPENKKDAGNVASDSGNKRRT